MLVLLRPLIDSKSNTDFMFIGANGDALDYGYFRRAYFAPAAKKLGLNEVTIHWLRHTCASMLIRIGAPISTISEILGHSSIKITLETYSHWYEAIAPIGYRSLGKASQNRFDLMQVKFAFGRSLCGLNFLPQPDKGFPLRQSESWQRS